MISLAEDKKMLGYGSLGSYSNISHFVTTRRGGCSKDAYATFNCSPFTDDEMEHVRRNQELLFEAMPVKLSELIIPHQTHGVKNLVIDRAFLALSEGERRVRLEGIDALVTDIPGCCICISTADCIPILLYDKQHQAIAAVHAGWRGTVNFIDSMILGMKTLSWSASFYEDEEEEAKPGKFEKFLLIGIF